VQHEGISFIGNANNPASFTLTLGGRYAVTVEATFGGGTVELQCQGPGGTFVSLKAPFNNAGTEADLVIGSFAAAGQKVLDLAPGTYKFVITTATVVSASIARAPLC
jgi:uncharacterized surface anchored protein